MSFKRLLVLFVLLWVKCSYAQNFTFSPGNDYYGVLDMDMYTEHYLYVNHDSPDSAHISWRHIENTCPPEWDFQLCDWQHCYSGVPNTGNMNSVAPGNPGNLRLIVNPYNIPGAGFVHFWIFPTGLIDEKVDVYFHFETIVASINEFDTLSSCRFSNNNLIITGTESGYGDIYNITGQKLESFRFTSGNYQKELTGLCSGFYICILNQQVFRFFKP